MALSPELEADLKKLAFIVEMAEGEFRLVFAHCNYVLLQQQLADRLGELTGIVTLRLQPGERTLAQVLELLRRRGGSLPPGVQVLGMEQMGDLPGGLAKLDQTRDQLQTQFPLPIVVWVNDDLQTAWKRYAPNLESWGAPKEFELDDETVAELIALKTKQLMERGWRVSTGEAEFLKRELAKAWARLEGKPLKDKTRAQLEALRGLTAEQLGDWLFGDPDFKHYQYALAYEGVWSTVESALLRRNSAWCGWRTAIEPQQIGIWIDGAQAGLINSEHWQESLPGLALTAWKLQDWARLQRLVAGETSPVALTYQALLAWHQQGREQAALALIEQAQAQWPQDRRPVERLLLIQLGGEIRAEQKDWQGLVSWLETAMEPLMALWTAPEPAFELPGALQPKQMAKDLFLGVLEHCRETYFERLRDYRIAFDYRQTLTRVKKQMGDYAFIGAGRMEAAAELEAAGRDQDVRALQERLLKPEHRLVILYGQSGVGKSSLLQAGLAPALKSQALGQARLCPVYVRRYDEKLQELTAGLELPAGADWEAIIARAREWDRQERRLVLIFDQFEEFFFAFPQREHQQRFFDGLAALLKAALSAKVVLSLRKDYLHFLLDYPQIAPNAAGVLAADNLYELGDFTSLEATRLIERLTERSNFRMMPELIERVVADLTREGKVRPIELQILGAQLQSTQDEEIWPRRIWTLPSYEVAGGKELLLQNCINEVTRACGPENANLAGAVLFLLTDEQGRRLLKTPSELATGLKQLRQRFEPSQLDLALDILGRSGLVVEIPEEPEARYQILHDYLVGLIRAQQEPLSAQLETELEQEKAQRFEAEGRLAQVRSEIEAAQREREKLALEKSALEADLETLQAKNQEALENLVVSQIQALVTKAEAKRLAYPTAIDNLLTAVRAQGRVMMLQGKIQNGIQWQTKLALAYSINSTKEVVQIEHSEPVNSVSFSSDGKNLASAGSDGTVYLWDTAMGQPRGEPLLGHSNSVLSVSFSFDGKLLASASSDKTVRLWEVKTGKPLGNPLLGHSNSVLSVSFSPDGKTLASASRDRTVCLWDVETGKPLGALQGHSGWVRHVSFSPDGKTLASASRDHTVRLWDVETGKLLGTLQGHSDSVMSVSFSPDGKILASASSDKTIRLWDVETGQPLGDSLQGHSSSVWSVSFSPNGKTLASASSDKTIRLWDVKTRKPLGDPLQGHSNWVRSVSFSPDGTTLASASADHTVRLWDVKTRKPLGDPLRGHSGKVRSVSFSPDGKTLASASSDKTICLWDVKTRKPLGDPLQGHSGSVNSVSFSPDGTTIASASRDCTVRLWDVQTRQPIGDPLQGHSGSVNSVSFSPDGKTLASVSFDKTVRLWDVETGKPLGDFLPGHSGSVNSVSFSPDGKTLASASRDRTVRLWDVQTRQPIGDPLQGHSGLVNSVSFSLNGKTLASASDDKTIRLWDVQTRQPIGDPLQGHSSWVKSASFSPDGKTLVSASYGGTVRLWNFNERQLMEEACGMLRLHLEHYTDAEIEKYPEEKEAREICRQYYSVVD